jgi:hypothetical protein
MEKYQNDFIKKVAASVQKYAPKYNILVNSPIIAQAILESAFGKSKLATDAFNFFGMKCGKSYTGEKITLNTREVINGKNVTVSADFRKYKSMAGGVKGYFDFINTDRYKNLKGVTDPKTYLENIKADGYATDPHYTSALMAVINKYDLMQYDSNQPQKKTETKTADKWSREKCIALIGDDVIKRGNYWGYGEVRKKRLFTEIQTRINMMSYHKISTVPQDPVEMSLRFIASDIIKNIDFWGCGETRKNKIYNLVQSYINQKV